jgi:hypothetical protein
MSLDLTGTSAAIFAPVVAMLLLTMLVWAALFVRRVSYLMSHKISAHKVQSPEQLTALLPADVNAPSNNFKNLFEMPVVFYVVCITAFSLQLVDGLLLNCAWGFVAIRVIHSLVHCTYNRVMHRFIAYLASSVLVWFMVIKVSLGIFG